MGSARRILRSRRDRVLCGVCGGLGEYFGVDPTLVRLAWVLLAILHPAAALLYLAACFIVPEERESAGVSGEAERSPPPSTRGFQASRALGAVALVAGLVLLAHAASAYLGRWLTLLGRWLSGLPWLSTLGELVLGAALLAVGLLLLRK